MAGIASSLEQLGQLAQAVVDLTLAQAIQRRAQLFLDEQAATLARGGRSGAAPAGEGCVDAEGQAKAKAETKAKAKAPTKPSAGRTRAPR